MSKKEKTNKSNSCWDRLQDFLYDSIDYVFMIIIVIVVALIINWRLGGLFGDTKLLKDDIISKKEQTESNIDKPIKEDDTLDKKPAEKKDSKDSEDKKTGKIIKISIPKGSASQNVCDILLENKLIEDKKDFMDYIEKEKVETKLKYGNYEIPEDSSYEEIVEILTK